MGEKNRYQSNLDTFLLYPIQDLDLTYWNRISHSYFKLPFGYPIFYNKKRSALSRIVLNRNWVSLANSSKDVTLKFSKEYQMDEATLNWESKYFFLKFILEKSKKNVV